MGAPFQTVPKSGCRFRSPQAAISAPRWAVERTDWHVDLEGRFAPEIVDGLRQRDHDARVIGAFDDSVGHAHAIEVLTPGYRVATDPRAEGAAAGL